MYSLCMKYQLIFVLLVFILSCGDETIIPTPKDTVPIRFEIENNDASFDQAISNIWVCHHPGTKMHGQICIDESYPRGCFVPGDTSKFCWELSEQDCVSQEHNWQHANCHLLGM